MVLQRLPKKGHAASELQHPQEPDTNTIPAVFPTPQYPSHGVTGHAATHKTNVCNLTRPPRKAASTITNTEGVTDTTHQYERRLRNAGMQQPETNTPDDLIPIPIKRFGSLNG